ncbi:MAG: hypothetical protein LBQ66_00525 [Planctomycetaceae bacterium]|nr:hypothetical protein [Planctomycetaceae bacterium]
MFNTSGVVPIQTEHATTTIHGINVKINDSPEKMCGITRAGRPRSSPSPLRGNCRLRRRVMIWNINTIPAPSRRGQAPVANIMRIHL